MDLSRTGVPKVLTSLREWRSADRLGPAGVAIGVVLVALGLILEGSSFGIGTAIRTLGGVLFLCGLSVVVFGDSRRRAVAIGMSRRIGARYMFRTANWGWPDRAGLAGVAIGVALIVPALVIQIIFANSLVVAVPAVILFWGGIFLLIYGRFYGRGALDTRGRPSSSSRSRRGGRGGERLKR